MSGLPEALGELLADQQRLVPSDQQDALLEYIGVLERWNHRHNLTAVRDPATMLRRHVGESLAIADHLPAGTLLDLGSGAGVPGLPVAITQPLRSCILLDASAKRTSFLQHVVARLSLRNVRVVTGRAEDQEPLGADVVVARALAPLPELLPLARRHCAPGGWVVAIKGPGVDEEQRELSAHMAADLTVIDVPVEGRTCRLVFDQQGRAS